MNKPTMYLHPTKLISPSAKYLLQIGKLYKITSIRLFSDEQGTSFSICVITDTCIQHFSNREIEGMILTDFGIIDIGKVAQN